MGATRRIAAAVIAVTAAAAVLTGCGGDDDASDAPLVVPAATTADDGPFAGKSGQEILTQAEAAMDAVTALTVDAHLTGEDGSSLHLTAALTDSGKCAASVEPDGEDPVQVIGIHDTYYLKADASFWQDQGGHGDVLARTFAGKWVRLPADEADGLDQFCDLSTVLSENEDSVVVSGKDTPTTRYGRPVIPLRASDAGDTVVYVAAQGTPYILGLVHHEGGGDVRFTGFDKAPEISAPPAGDTVDLGSVGGDAPDLSV